MEAAQKESEPEGQGLANLESEVEDTPEEVVETVETSPEESQDTEESSQAEEIQRKKTNKWRMIRKRYHLNNGRNGTRMPRQE